MKRINKENNFFIILFCFIFLLLGICNISFVKSTLAGFGDMTGQLTAKYSIEYLSNYPSKLGLAEEFKTDIVQNIDYVISENKFNLDGYEFINWNTSSDGTGDIYESGDEIKLEKNISLYAQWEKVDVVVILYGDVNLDGIISDDDYLSIEQHISLEKILEGQSLLNADVNVDGKIDLVDVDIIKQVSLGTEGYIGMLPDKPILIYEIYNDNVSDEEENNNGNQPSGDMSGNNGSSSNGNGTSGNGNGSSNNGSSGNNSSSGGTDNKPSSDGTSENNKNESDDVVVNDKEENKDDEFVIEKEDVDENDSNDNVDNNDKNIYPLIIVFCICLIAFRLIVYIIKRFNEKNDFDKENFK